MHSLPSPTVTEQWLGGRGRPPAPLAVDVICQASSTNISKVQLPHSRRLSSGPAAACASCCILWERRSAFTDHPYLKVRSLTEAEQRLGGGLRQLLQLLRGGAAAARQAAACGAEKLRPQRLQRSRSLPQPQLPEALVGFLRVAQGDFTELADARGVVRLPAGTPGRAAAAVRSRIHASDTVNLQLAAGAGASGGGTGVLGALALAGAPPVPLLRLLQLPLCCGPRRLRLRQRLQLNHQPTFDIAATVLTGSVQTDGLTMHKQLSQQPQCGHAAEQCDVVALRRRRLTCCSAFRLSSVRTTASSLSAATVPEAAEAAEAPHCAEPLASAAAPHTAMPCGASSCRCSSPAADASSPSSEATC